MPDISPGDAHPGSAEAGAPRQAAAPGPSTRSVHLGEGVDPDTRALIPPVVANIAFAYDDVESWREVALGRAPGHIYSRNSNPTTARFEAKVAALEGARAATSFASGMAAVSSTLLALLRPGARAVTVRDATLGLRVERQNSNALRISRWLADHPKVAAVHYPGLSSHPGHHVAKAQMRGFGGVLSFELTGGYDAVRRALPRLKYAYLAANLGQVETIAGPPATTSHVELTDAERAEAGIPEGLIRYSAGIEDADDLIGDLAYALEAA